MRPHTEVAIIFGWASYLQRNSTFVVVQTRIRSQQKQAAHGAFVAAKRRAKKRRSVELSPAVDVGRSVDQQPAHVGVTATGRLEQWALAVGVGALQRHRIGAIVRGAVE